MAKQAKTKTPKNNKRLSFKDMLKSTGTRTLRASSSHVPRKGVTRLCDAEKVGVSVKVGRTNSLASISLCLTNTTMNPANIELTGSVLLPSNAGSQRLFVAGLEAEPMTLVTIEPHSEKQIDVATCCMDKSKRCPSEDVEYRCTDRAPRSQDVEAAHTWINARRVGDKLPPLPMLSRINTDSFCIQRAFRGETTKRKEFSGDKTKIGYVQAVCWDECAV